MLVSSIEGKMLDPKQQVVHYPIMGMLADAWTVLPRRMDGSDEKKKKKKKKATTIL